MLRVMLEPLLAPQPDEFSAPDRAPGDMIDRYPAAARAFAQMLAMLETRPRLAFEAIVQPPDGRRYFRHRWPR
jgi:hypothetical protein